MFSITRSDITKILEDFNIFSEITCVSELERYHYERRDPDTKNVRLIVKVELETGGPLVTRFKNEDDVTIETIESQCRFADEMRKHGIVTPRQYQSDGAFARWYTIDGYDVIVTVEQFAENEIRVVDAELAWKTGELLARMHTIAEQNDLHVKNGVLFDPFQQNDLFDFASFQSIGSALSGDDKALYDRIIEKYSEYMAILLPLKERPRYAVQGDISNCNLYRTSSGQIGIFDYNRCGDNELFCDAVMQAMFEARLMDYPEQAGPGLEAEILDSFWRGYHSLRELTEEERNWYPYLRAVIDAFWSMDIKWRENSLMNAVKNGDTEKVRKWLAVIWERLTPPRT